MSDETKKVSEAKGPYTYSMYAGDAKAMNAAYAEGFKAGRDSREDVVSAAKYVVSAVDCWKARLAVEELEKALADDGEAMQ